MTTRTPAGDAFIRRTAIAVGISAFALLLLALFVLGIRILLAAFGGLLLGVLLNAFSRFAERNTPLSYRAALTAVTVFLVLLLGGLGWLAAPQISQQAEELGQELPALMQSVEANLEGRLWGRWVLQQARSGRIPGAQGMDGGGVLSALSGGSTYLLVVVLVGLFGAANPGLYRQGIIDLFPVRGRARVREVIDELVHTLRWWLIGQGFAMILIGASTGVMLWLFGLPFAGLLGFVVGLLGFVPFLGPLVGAVPVALIAATEGAAMLLWVMIAYTAIQMLEGYVATPLIQHRTVYLPPVFTIISQILLGAVLGTMGVIMATPLAAVALVLSRYYRSDVLGDPEAEEGRRRR